MDPNFISIEILLSLTCVNHVGGGARIQEHIILINLKELAFVNAPQSKYIFLKSIIHQCYHKYYPIVYIFIFCQMLKQVSKEVLFHPGFNPCFCQNSDLAALLRRELIFNSCLHIQHSCSCFDSFIFWFLSFECVSALMIS